VGPKGPLELRSPYGYGNPEGFFPGNTIRCRKSVTPSFHQALQAHAGESSDIPLTKRY